MKNLAKGIVKYVGTFLLAASCCTAQPSTPEGYLSAEQVKQELAKEEKEKKITLEEKLNTIHDALKSRELNYTIFGSPKNRYLLSIENIDKDGKPDYVLLVGKPGDKRFPLSPALLYIEDTSKESGTGNVDRTMFYGKENGIKKVERVSVADLEKSLKEYEEIRKSDPDDKKALMEAQQEFFNKKSIMVNANALYMTLINGLYNFIESQK